MNKITSFSFTIAAHNLNGALLHLTMCFSHSGHSCMNALYYFPFFFIANQSIIIGVTVTGVLAIIVVAISITGLVVGVKLPKDRQR